MSGRAIDQVTKVINVASGYGDSVRVLGCNGAAVNTGRSGGVFRLLKLIQGKPVHWFVCQLQSNELVLRELFRELDGKTRGRGHFRELVPPSAVPGASLHTRMVSNQKPQPVH